MDWSIFFSFCWNSCWGCVAVETRVINRFFDCPLICVAYSFQNAEHVELPRKVTRVIRKWILRLFGGLGTWPAIKHSLFSTWTSSSNLACTFRRPAERPWQWSEAHGIQLNLCHVLAEAGSPTPTSLWHLSRRLLSGPIATTARSL